MQRFGHAGKSRLADILVSGGFYLVKNVDLIFQKQTQLRGKIQLFTSWRSLGCTTSGIWFLRIVRELSKREPTSG